MCTLFVICTSLCVAKPYNATITHLYVHATRCAIDQMYSKKSEMTYKQISTIKHDAPTLVKIEKREKCMCFGDWCYVQLLYNDETNLVLSDGSLCC